MGSPAYEPGHESASDSPGEPLHDVRIPHSFAIASKEVTVAQFQRFLDANPDVRQHHAYDGRPDRMSQVMRDFSPDSTGPQIAVTWYEAAMYCNWLSAQEGLPESEWVYPSATAMIRSGLKLPENYLHRAGFRLPTEAEWEYAARAGTTTSHFFGIADSLLPEYAWYSHYPPQRKTDPIDPRDPNRTWPVGQLKPNDLGLFDVYGNVWEWTQDRVARHTTNAMVIDVEDTMLVVTDSAARTRRSGGFPYPWQMMRSAERGTTGAFPTARRDNVGFRVAQTVR
jgi:formylglycine-generating enzyme required for sulfatase activity